jgi:hypothetical protein
MAEAGITAAGAMIKRTATREIAPYYWVHPDEKRQKSGNRRNQQPCTGVIGDG